MSLTWFHTHFLVVQTAGAIVHTRSVTVAHRFRVTTFGQAAISTAISNYKTQSKEHVNRFTCGYNDTGLNSHASSYVYVIYVLLHEKDCIR